MRDDTSLFVQLEVERGCFVVDEWVCLGYCASRIRDRSVVTSTSISPSQSRLKPQAYPLATTRIRGNSFRASMKICSVSSAFETGIAGLKRSGGKRLTWISEDGQQGPLVGLLVLP